MRKVFLVVVFVLFMASQALAHFGMVIPSTSTIMDKNEAQLNLQLSFSHPMDMEGMPLEKPASFKVFVNEESQDLLPSLKPMEVMGHPAWSADYLVQRPGVYQFVMEPQPYWEAAEDIYIVHYTKTIIPAFGEEEGWDEPVGIKTEIVPLTRPFGNYAGNVFQGMVLVDGQPAPFVEVEVEFYNRDEKYLAPNAYAVTHMVKTDAQGVFTYGIPFAGWWGFAALNIAEKAMDFEGQAKDVELGALLWVEYLDPVRP